MTKKSRRESLRDSLSSAVRPPEANPKLDEILGRYATAQPMLGQTAQAQVEAEAGTHPTPPPAQTHPQPTPGPVAAERDYYKRPNSIERIAVPAGLFPGGTKHTYDALFQRTRGARTPTRSIQAKKRELMLWADVSNEKTIESHIKHLCAVGLLVRTGSNGDNNGYFYEVVTPEEAGLAGAPAPAQTQAHPQPTPVQNMASPQAQKLPPGGLGQTVEPSSTSGEPKTSFKTNTENDDDEALAGLLAQIRKAVKEITGREPAAAEAERWRELGELLVTELKIAAGRTTVSNVPAFFTEHLRRRLWKKEKRQLDEEAGSKGHLTPATTFTGDASKCPDCFGTGMYYPGGFDKGVARCEHKTLSEADS